MTETAHTAHPTSVALGSEAPIVPSTSCSGTSPTAYAAPARFLDLSHAEDLAMLAKLAAQLLQEPLAVQKLSDRVLELLQHDLTLQRERSGSYGRR